MRSYKYLSGKIFVMKLLITIALGFLLPVFAFAQTEEETDVPQNVYINIPGRSMIRLEASSGLEIPKSRLKGTPYLFEEWRTGRLVVEGNRVVNNFTFNLNVYRNRLDFKHEGDLMSITQPERMVRLEYGDRIFHYRSYKERKKTKDAYMELLADGPVVLYKRFECKLLEPSYNEALAVGDRNYRLIHHHDYYLGHADKLLLEIKTKKRSVLKALPNKKDKVRKYLKTNGLNLKDEYDLIRLIRYYNTIGE